MTDTAAALPDDYGYLGVIRTDEGSPTPNESRGNDHKPTLEYSSDVICIQQE